MATAKKAVPVKKATPVKKTAKKAANRKKADLTEKGFVSITGSDPRNGIVTLKKFGNGFLLTNSRTGLEESIKAFTKATAAYDYEINNSQK